MDRWLTPDTPAAGFICRRLFIPNGLDWLAIVQGALLELCQQYNFESDGSSSVAATAQAFFEMFRRFVDEPEDECAVIGQIMCTAFGATPLATWLPCDGASLLRTDYPALFSRIGTVFGSADSTHFNVPDLRGRVGVGSGTGSGLTTRDLGDEFGSETHTLTIPEIPSHAHSEVTALAAFAQTPLVPVPSAIPLVGVTGVAGGNGAHNNVQPSLALAYWIVAG